MKGNTNLFSYRTTHIPRFGDLDTQLHVTSRTYETFADEARFSLLAEHGYDFRRITKENLVIVPTHSHVNFVRQQMPGNRLICHTYAIPEMDGVIYWHQQFFDVEERLAAEIFTLTHAFQKAGEVPRALLGSFENHSKNEAPEKNQTVVSEELIKRIHENRGLLIEPKSFSGSCKQIERKNTPLYTLRNFNWQYSSGELWRLTEDGRWHMFHVLGIDFDLIRATDTTAFFMGATFRYYRPPVANETLLQKTWIERIEKIRMYIRQDLFRVDEPDHPILSSREFVIFVSVSRSRPKRVDPEWMKLVHPYIEFPSE